MREGRQTTTGVLPTRDFLLVLDPQFIGRIPAVALQMVRDLARFDPPLRFSIIIPRYLMKPEERATAAVLFGAAQFLDDPEIGRDFALGSHYPADDAEQLLNDDSAEQHMALLGLAYQLQANALITDRPLLFTQRYTLYQHHTVSIVTPSELPEFIGLCGRGHSIFWTEESPIHLLTYDLFYVTTHWKVRRYAKWCLPQVGRIANPEFAEALRSLLLNRMVFLVYARDMVRFYQIQRDHYTRRDLLDRHGMAIAYHLNHFYLLLWGLLDHLTVVAKHALDLDLDERNCGIAKKGFLSECRKRRGGLVAVIESEKISEWIGLIAELRHAAAHSTLRTPRPLYLETDKSTLPKERVREIVIKENEDLLGYARVMRSDLSEWMIERMIEQWRIRQSRKVSDSVVIVRREGRRGFIDPVINLDFDLERGFAICDAFLVGCFSRADHG